MSRRFHPFQVKQTCQEEEPCSLCFSEMPKAILGHSQNSLKPNKMFLNAVNNFNFFLLNIVNISI